MPGVDHPSGRLKRLLGVAIDGHGNRYVASQVDPPEVARIDIFGPSGAFLYEIPLSHLPEGLAVDSAGNLYVGILHFGGPGTLDRYEPTEYDPAAGRFQYEDASTIASRSASGIVVNPTNDHVFAVEAGRTAIAEYGSAAEGNQLVSEIGAGEIWSSAWLALDAAHDRIYASTNEGPPLPEVENGPVIKVFDLQAPHELIATFDGAATPSGQFLSPYTGDLPVAVDEESGDFFVAEEGFGSGRAYEFKPDGGYVGTITREGWNGRPGEIEVDNSPASPTRGYLFAPSGGEGPGNSLAFERRVFQPPAIEAVLADGIGEREAVARAKINPNSEATTYRIEYASQQSFEDEGADSFVLAEAGNLTAEPEGVWVAAALEGLAPGTRYRLRVSAQNGSGNDEHQAAFATYHALDLSTGCANDPLRTGASAALPDCRAYELVTPPDTNGRSPKGPVYLGDPFGMRTVSPNGSRVSFRIEGGAIPEYDVAGGILGDPYLATRENSGWQTESAGPDGRESSYPVPGAVSPDQGYSFWSAAGEGTAVLDGETHYLHFPDGESELLGSGSLGSEPFATGLLITEDGSHVIFQSGHAAVSPSPVPLQLEPEAPPSGTEALYDRTSDGVTHVVSLLPEEKTPLSGQEPTIAGASPDGTGIAFSLGGKSYLRYQNEETFELGAGIQILGIAEGGRRVTYLQGGDIYGSDVPSNSTVRFTESGDVTAANVATGGDVVYFVSPSALTTEANPVGAQPEPGAQNLYRSKEGQISFVAILTKRDVDGEFSNGAKAGGLGLWTGFHRVFPGADPSRTTSNGDVLVFESRAPLTGFDSAGHAQVFRYDAAAPSLHCLSCPPTLSEPTGAAGLQSFGLRGELVPLISVETAVNLALDGRRVFFESPDPLVPADRDGLLDVYEWEDEGVGSCRTTDGCTYLISSPKNAQPDYLYGVSDSGDDVFFSSTSLLDASRDRDETASIYDARVGGGFQPPAAGASECLGEACQPTVSPPIDSTPASVAFQGSGNVSDKPPRRPCPKGKRPVRRGGKVRCVPRRRHHAHRNSRDRRHHR